MFQPRSRGKGSHPRRSPPGAPTTSSLPYFPPAGSPVASARDMPPSVPHSQPTVFPTVLADPLASTLFTLLRGDVPRIQLGQLPGPGLGSSAPAALAPLPDTVWDPQGGFSGRCHTSSPSGLPCEPLPPPRPSLPALILTHSSSIALPAPLPGSLVLL